MANIRTFIAFDTPAKFKEILTGVQVQLKENGADVRWETEDKFHATIKFLGNTDEAILPQISGEINGVIEQFRPIQLHFDRIGFFPNNKSPRVVWAGSTKQEPAIEDLKRRLDEALSPFGFEIEERAFHPHITLGRIKSERGAKHLISKAEKINFGTFTITIGEILLMKSVLRPTGSLYTVLQTFSLKS